jgi:hypothetical protein
VQVETRHSRTAPLALLRSHALANMS